jgi:hypothetical protein
MHGSLSPGASGAALNGFRLDERLFAMVEAIPAWPGSVDNRVSPPIPHLVEMGTPVVVRDSAGGRIVRRNVQS